MKAVCLLSGVDALLNLWRGGSMIVGGDPMLPWPIAVALGVGIVGQALWQLLTIYGLYMLKPSAYRWILGALQAGLVVDFVGVFLGRSSWLDVAITVGVLAYLYLRRDTFVPAGRR